MKHENTIQFGNKSRLTRPIQLIGDKPYFACNLPIADKGGKPANSWIVCSADFRERYSELPVQEHTPLSEAPFQCELVGMPRPGSMLSADAYKRYLLDGTALPSIKELFMATRDAIDRFVAFDGSFAPQEAMSDFLACWAISTYATPVFDTVGYVWPNGERGSGKTQCLKTLMSLACMGQTIASSSSFASVRDEAALGASLGFDDCENVRRMDNDKRELLLAGNTRGSGFIHKEPGKREGSWVTRYIDCFAPRAFTSIGLPDEVLASRTLLIPLIRTGDTKKTRLKPTNSRDWVVPAHEIRDGLWLVVSQNLLVIEGLKDAVNDDSDRSGRDFDIFQPTLTIAKWLDEAGAKDGLYKSMLDVMEAYFVARQTTSLPSREALVLQALLEMLEDKQVSSLTCQTREIVERFLRLCEQRDITDEELRSTDVQHIGILLGRLGFSKNPSHRKERSWTIKKDHLLKVAKVAGVTLDHHPVVEGTGEVYRPF